MTGRRQSSALIGRTRWLLLVTALVAGCASATPSATLTPTLEPTATPMPTPSPTPVPIPTPIPLDKAMLPRRFTVLMVGADTSPSRRASGLNAVNTDAMLLVSVSADKSRIDLISLPRDTVDVPMPDGTVYRGKINGMAQKLGIGALRNAISTLLGVPIDRYLRVDMDDFSWMVDAVGGIDLTLASAISDPQVHLSLRKGPNHLDGAHALAFSRTRVDSDYDGAARQQVVMRALTRKWMEAPVQALLGSAFRLGSLETDIRLDELPTLLEIGRRSASVTVTMIVLRPPRYSRFVGIEPNSNRGWVMIPNVAEMRRYARSALSD